MDIKKIVNGLTSKAASLRENSAGFTGEALENLLNEASAAMAKAKELAAKYDIQLDELPQAEELGGLVYQSSLESVCPMQIGMHTWFHVLLSAVAEIVPVRFARAGIGNRTRILGYETDVAQAAELLTTLESLALEFQKSLTIKNMAEYLLGFALGCQAILAAQAAEASEASEATAENADYLALNGAQTALIVRHGMIHRAKLQKLTEALELAGVIKQPKNADTPRLLPKPNVDRNKGLHDGLTHQTTRVTA